MRWASPMRRAIVSAHRTPERLYAFAKGAKAAGFKVIIAGAGGAAHLPGMTAALTSLPVFGVPVEVEGAVGPGFALFHRADAAGRSGRYAGDRAGRRRQRRAAGGERLGAERHDARNAARSLAAARRPKPSPRRRRTPARERAAPVLDAGATIGILGGGQLGRMLALAAARLGFQAATSSRRIPTRPPSMSCTG